jgi:hypothetical protein
LKRFSNRIKDPQPLSFTSQLQNWSHCQQLFSEFGIALRRFGKLGTASLSAGRLVFIKLDSGAWRVRRMSLGTWKTVAANRDLATLRLYLTRNAST